MKTDEEVMEILEAFDLTRSYRDAGELAGCSHHTVAHHVERRDAGLLVAKSARRAQIIDPHREKLEELVEHSRGKVRADVAHAKLVSVGFEGSERTSRRAVAVAKKNYRAGNRRIYRPWITEPGKWFQWDFGWGPVIGGRQTLLFCAWLSWSRFRVVLPIWDKSLPTVIACLDTTLRHFGGCPTYGLTDNERTVTIEHIATMAVRNPEMVLAGRHYGLTVLTCMVADPETKGGSEATVRIAKADLVPTEANLAPGCTSLGELESAYALWCDEVNGREHRITRRVPAEMLVEERRHLHVVPAHPYTLAFGQTRTVGSTTPMVAFENCSYSAPSRLAAEVVWVREHGDEIVMVHIGDDGPTEVARHQRTTPGNPKVDEAHFPEAPPGPLNRKPKATNPGEAAFLAIGPGATDWLTEAAAVGTVRMRVKMANAVALAKLHDDAAVDDALGEAARTGRFDEPDLASILAHRARRRGDETRQATETASLAQGTRVWERVGA